MDHTSQNFCYVKAMQSMELYDGQVRSIQLVFSTFMQILSHIVREKCICIMEIWRIAVAL